MAPSDHERRRSETTTLYQIVQQHLETYLALAGEADWDGQHVRADVERECRHYLGCGVFAQRLGATRPGTSLQHSMLNVVSAVSPAPITKGLDQCARTLEH